jgi:CMP-N,N'-diacetyllegionaminic acid synthase
MRSLARLEKKMSSMPPKVLGIIGIRSGSTGVKNKNIKKLAGKPLVGWILSAASKARTLNKIVVSTDSKKYMAVARKFGAETPCIRPKRLAQNTSPEIDYVKHMLCWLKDHENYVPDYVVRMMATVPFQSSDDIDSLVNILIANPDADSAVVISEARQHPMKALKIIKNGNQKELISYFGESSREVTPIARQLYPTAYFRSNIIACRHHVIFEKDSLTGDKVLYHEIPQERALDIDNTVDFKIAETLAGIYSL